MKRIRPWAIPAAVAVAVLVHGSGYAGELRDGEPHGAGLEFLGSYIMPVDPGSCANGTTGQTMASAAGRLEGAGLSGLKLAASDSDNTDDECINKAQKFREDLLTTVKALGEKLNEPGDHHAALCGAVVRVLRPFLKMEDWLGSSCSNLVGQHLIDESKDLLAAGLLYVESCRAGGWL